jgi:hypothetical protein
MNIGRQILCGSGFNLPSVVLTPSCARGAALVIHGYGGCKEEQLGLAWRVAEFGLMTYVIDLRGHGEHPLMLDGNVLQDAEVALRHCRPFGKTVAIGHSLGGRLALVSGADYAIGISPALATEFSVQTEQLLKGMRGHRVREVHPRINFDTLRELPVWRPLENRGALILYGSRDIPEIVASCKQLKTEGAAVVQIEDALHSDIFLHQTTIDHITTQLDQWFKVASI